MELASAVDELREILRGEGRAALLENLLQLERRVHSLREGPMRRAVTREFVSGLEAAPLIAFLDLLMQRNRDGVSRTRGVMQQFALEPTVLRDLPYTRTKLAYQLALETQRPQVAELFMGDALDRDTAHAIEFQSNDHMDLPAGIRLSAARLQDRFRLDRLIHDRDPRVISNLLHNPRIVERDVVKIAAMRPTNPAVLLVVAGHPRWSSNYRVRKAITLNPHTPESLVRRLLPTLMRQDLKLALRSGVLKGRAKAHAQALIQPS